MKTSAIILLIVLIAIGIGCVGTIVWMVRRYMNR